MIDESTIAAWDFALKEIPDDLGRAAFGMVMRQNTYGTPEPAHVIAAAEELKYQKTISRTGSEPFVSEAPKFWGEIDEENPSEEHRVWKQQEAKKNYRAIESKTDEILLVQNPASWEFRRDENGKPFWIKRPPIHTGEFVRKPGFKKSNYY